MWSHAATGPPTGRPILAVNPENWALMVRFVGSHIYSHSLCCASSKECFLKVMVAYKGAFFQFGLLLPVGMTCCPHILYNSDDTGWLFSWNLVFNLRRLDYLVKLSAVVRWLKKGWLGCFLVVGVSEYRPNACWGFETAVCFFMSLLSGDWLVWIKRFVAGLLTGMIKCAGFTFSSGTPKMLKCWFFSGWLQSFVLFFPVWIFRYWLIYFYHLFYPFLVDSKGWMGAINAS